MNKLWNKKGITLVSLVITIIILIVLISITTTVILNSNSTLKRAVWADKRADVLAFRDEIEEKISMYQVEQDRSQDITFKSYIMKKFSVSEENITYYDSAKAVAFYYEDYFMVIDERELEVKCIGADVIQEEKVGVVYKDILNDGYYVLRIKKTPNWWEFWTKADYFKKIKTVVVADGVTSFASSTCGGATSIENVYLPETVTEIGQTALSKTSIKEIYLPSKVTYIGIAAFSNCEELEKVHFPEYMLEIDEMAFRQCYKLDNVIIPNGVTTIHKQCFYECFNLKNVQLPDTLETIGSQIFYNCDKLETVVIPEGVSVLPSWAFRSCNVLSSIKLPETITTIEIYAFYQCYALEELYIPKSVTTIAASNFHGVPLKKLYYGGSQEDWAGVTVEATGNSNLTEKKMYYYSETEPETEGQYWHYVDGVITEW